MEENLIKTPQKPSINNAHIYYILINHIPKSLGQLKIIANPIRYSVPGIILSILHVTHLIANQHNVYY